MESPVLLLLLLSLRCTGSHATAVVGGLPQHPLLSGMNFLTAHGTDVTFETVRVVLRSRWCAAATGLPLRESHPSQARMSAWFEPSLARDASRPVFSCSHRV